MAEVFRCTVCNEEFSLPEHVREKYPNWTPKYCVKHSPKKDSSSQSGASKKDKKSSVTAVADLKVDQVLEKFNEGPDSGIFTDGGSRPNPGPGGWGAVYVKNGKIVEQRYGSEEQTTNNRMELTAIIEGLKMVKEKEAIDIYCDSELTVNILTKWGPTWKRNGWQKKKGPIQNLDLVRKAYELFEARPNINLHWVKAHNGWKWNEYVDSLASAWARDEL